MPAAAGTAAPGVVARPAATSTPAPAPSPPYSRLGWRSLGSAITGGRVTAVAGSARDPFLYYVGSAGGGVWKTTNGGATWQPVFDKTGVSSIGAVALDPSDDGVVWVATGETNPRNDVSYGAGLYKSSDGGKTFAYVGLRDTLQIPRSSSIRTMRGTSSSARWATSLPTARTAESSVRSTAARPGSVRSTSVRKRA